MPQTVPPDISVLVPVMNEQGNIRPLIDEITAVYAGRSFEIIYVNDGSDDGTADELKRAAAAVKQLQVLTHERRTGQSAALRTALYRARAPLIAVLDGDGQNIPSDLPALEAALLNIRPAQGMAAGVRVARHARGARVEVRRLRLRARRRVGDVAEGLAVIVRGPHLAAATLRDVDGAGLAALLHRGARAVRPRDLRRGGREEADGENDGGDDAHDERLATLYFEYPSSTLHGPQDPSSGAPGPQRRLLLAAKRLKSCGHSARAAKIPQNQLLSCETPAKISRRGRAFSRNRQALDRIRTEGLGRPI